MSCSGQQKCCRICFERAQDRSPLIAPCQCKGSSLYIHVHCLEIWQQISLQNNLPQKAEICPICQSEFTYPSRAIRFYRRVIYSISNFWNFSATLTSLLWISFVIVPVKVIIYAILVLCTIPYGQLSLLGNTAVAWIGFDFPPQLALIYTYPVDLLTRHIWPLPITAISSESRRDRFGHVRRSSSSSISLLSPLSSTQLSVLDLASGVLLVASKEVPPSSMFYRAVILLLDYNPSIGSRGVIINFDTTSNPSIAVSVPNLRSSTSDFFSSLPKIPSMRYGLGGPMESDVVTVLHKYPSCSRYSERCVIPTKSVEKEEPFNSFIHRENSFYFAENQYALRTLLKISDYLFHEDEEGLPSLLLPQKPSAINNARLNLSSYGEVKTKLKTALHNLTRKLNFTLLRPFPFFDRRPDEDMEEGDPLAEPEVAVLAEDSSSSPRQSRRRSTVRHRFFKNPNYRKLSADTHPGLSPHRIQQHLLSEVKERLQHDRSLSSNPFRELPLISQYQQPGSAPSRVSRVSWSQSTEFSSNDGKEHETSEEGLDLKATAFSDGSHEDGEDPLLFAIKGNCIWLANQLEGEIMHGFWHVVPEYSVRDIFSDNPEVIRNLWNQLIQASEEQ